MIRYQPTSKRVFLLIDLILLILIFLLPVFFYNKLSSEKNARERFLASLDAIIPFNLSETPSVSNLLSKVSSGNIFRPLTEGGVKKKVKVKTVDTLAKDYILIGIVSLENKEAILKNKRTRKTLFVREGMSIGELNVREISSDKVILEYNGDEKVIFLS